MTRHMQSPSVTDVPEPDWVVEMRQHFMKTGTYRQSDLDQVLGKPWDAVKVGASGHLELTSGVLHVEKPSRSK